MNRDNPFYLKVVRKLRQGWLQGILNPYLTVKNKCYMTLFAVAPRKVRLLHRKWKGLGKA